MGRNQALPGQITVAVLLEKLKDADPGALVIVVDPYTDLKTLYPIVDIEDKGPVIKLSVGARETE